MNLTEIRKTLGDHDEVIVTGGTFHYCNFHVPKLDKLGRRTGRVQPCGKKLRKISQMTRHLRRHAA